MNAVAQPRRRKAGISSNSCIAVAAVAARRGQDLFRLYGHLMAAARDGNAHMAS